MYVCICQQVSDADIEQAVANGEASTISELSRKLGVAQSCGECSLDAKKILEQALLKLDQKLA